MRFFRTYLLALLTLVGLLVAPISSAIAAINCAVIGPGAGGFAIIGTPSETGTVGVPYNSQFTTDAGAFVTAIGTVPPGLTTSNTGTLFDIILISGTPTTAGSYNLSFDIKVAADAYRCTWTLVIDGGAGGGGQLVAGNRGHSVAGETSGPSVSHQHERPDLAADREPVRYRLEHATALGDSGLCRIHQRHPDVELA